MNLEHLIAGYGLWALGLGAGLEGETVVVIGGIMVHHGTLAFVPAVLSAALGSFLADQLFFVVGRRFRSWSYVRKLRRRPAYRRAIIAFERQPTVFVFAFRFLYGLRTISPLAIGTTRLSTLRFLVINAIAALVWSAVFICVGFAFGQAIESVFGKVQAIAHVVLGVVGIAIAFGIATHFLLRWRGDD